MLETKSIALLDHLIGLRKGDCEGTMLARQIRFEDGSLAYVEENEPFLHAIYLIKGVCYKQDYSKAAEVLQKIIDYPDRTHLYAMAYARLGALYLRGQGVKKNLKKADDLFKQAALKLTVDEYFFTRKFKISRKPLPPMAYLGMTIQ